MDSFIERKGVENLILDLIDGILFYIRIAREERQMLPK